MGTKFSIKEALDNIDAEVDRESYELWGNSGLGINRSPDTELFSSPKFQELIHVLLSDPILVAPALNWLKMKQAEISRAKLEALYTPEQLEEMYKSLQNND